MCTRTIDVWLWNNLRQNLLITKCNHPVWFYCTISGKINLFGLGVAVFLEKCKQKCSNFVEKNAVSIFVEFDLSNLFYAKM